MIKTQSGNVLFLILIAVALFGALSYAVTQSTRTGGNADSETSRLTASEILNYANTINTSIVRMQALGCSAAEISFENNANPGDYVNPNAPSDNSCHVFDAQGGGAPYQKISSDWLDESNSANPGYEEFLVSGKVEVSGIGVLTGGPEDMDLTFLLPYLKRGVCDAINESLNMAHSSGNPPVENADAWRDPFEQFAGTYGGVHIRTLGDGQSPTGYEGCREGNGNPPSGTYFFYKVLIPR